MRTIGVRELKANISEVLRAVDEEGETVEVTRHGQVIARLVPARTRQPDGDNIRAVLADLDRLAAEISAHWPEGISAVDAINDVRRDL